MMLQKEKYNSIKRQKEYYNQKNKIRNSLYLKKSELNSNVEKGGRSLEKPLRNSIFDLFLEGHTYLF